MYSYLYYTCRKSLSIRVVVWMKNQHLFFIGTVTADALIWAYWGDSEGSHGIYTQMVSAVASSQKLRSVVYIETRWSVLDDVTW